MTFFDGLLLAIILAICCTGAYTDIRFGVVKNRQLVVALLGATLVSLLQWIQGPPSASEIYDWGINITCALGLSVVFYLQDLWAPGDAKLFLCMAAIYPRGLYAARVGNVFPSLNFAVSAFALGYLYLVFQALVRHERVSSVDISSCFGSGKAKDYVINVGIAIGLQAMLGVFWPAFFTENKALCLLVIVSIGIAARRYVPRARVAAGAIGFLYYLFEIIRWCSWLSFGSMLLYALVLAVAIQLLQALTKSAVYRDVSADGVHAGMILSLGSVVAMQKCIDPDLPRRTSENRRSRMTQAQAEAVRRWGEKTGNPISIVEMLPFAPFIALSAIMEFGRFALWYMGR
jgi:hypothetical protein